MKGKRVGCQITKRWKHKAASGSWRATRQDRGVEASGRQHGNSLSMESRDGVVVILRRDYVAIIIQIVVASVGTKVNWVIMILENEAEEAEQTAVGFARETERENNGSGCQQQSYRHTLLRHFFDSWVLLDQHHKCRVVTLLYSFSDRLVALCLHTALSICRRFLSLATLWRILMLPYSTFHYNTQPFPGLTKAVQPGRAAPPDCPVQPGPHA